jgi:hypothetical protein
MQQAYQGQRAAIIAEADYAVPVSPMACHNDLRGWSPPEAWQIQADFSVTWLNATGFLKPVWPRGRDCCLAARARRARGHQFHCH